MNNPSDPYSQLPFRSDKVAGLTTELHLGNRNITHLVNFEAFLTLDCLWLNNNLLTSLKGLEANFRIKHIYAHSNKIRSLSGNLGQFTFLETLTLNENVLDDIDDVVSELKKLKYLSTINLYDNPIAQEDNYRLRIISEVPWIKMLDRISIYEEDVIQAKEFKKKMDSLQNYTFKAKKLPPSDSEIEAARLDRLLVDSALAKLRAKVKKSRVFLEKDFFPYDTRILGTVSEDVFWKVLGNYGVVEILTEDESIALVKEYKDKHKVPALSMTNTRIIKGISYKRLCSDLLPSVRV